MKKRFSVLLCIAMAAIALAGCASGNASMMSTTAPIVTGSPRATGMTLTPTTSPQGDMPGMNGDANGAMNEGMNGNANADMAGATSGATTWQKDGAEGATASDEMTPAQMGTRSAQIAEAVARISEIDDAEVVIHGNRVLVAVEFEDQYKAGLDERIREMITEAVKKVDSNLTEIKITDDDTLYGQVDGLADRTAKATGMDELSDGFADLWDRVKEM